MPTPSDDTLQEYTGLECPESSHSAFASSRASEQRDARPARGDTTADVPPRPLAREAECAVVDSKVEEATGVPTPPPSETESESSTQEWTGATARARSSTRPSSRREKEEQIVAAQPIESPNTPRAQESDIVQESTEAGLARSLSNTSISADAPPQYLYYPEVQRERHEKLTTSFLRPGSKFVGTQTSDRQRYEVQVEIKDVDLEESFLCGYLRIQGLTDDHPTLTTFFEGEIIGPKYKFKTAHPSWGSSEKIDMTHWACFPEWKRLAKSSRTPNFTAPNHLQREQLFMRWKEYFLVPDHRVKTITGASFEGFYYICFNQCSGGVDGVYFHAKSEKWQQLRLEHVEDRGCVGAMEFR